MSDYDIHSCGYYCDRPACIKAQRDELRDKLFSDQCVKTYSGGKPNYTQPIEPPNLKGDDFERAFYRDWEAGKVKRVFEPEPMIDDWPLYSGLPPIKVQDKSFEEFAQSFAQSARVNGIPEAKKEWVGLTDETYWEMWVESPSDVLRFAHAIEAKLREKNG
jgi:hypothetical protein